MNEKKEQGPTPLESLLERLRSDGGRYLLSIAMTSEEYKAQEPPTFGGKARTRWLTDHEHAALCAALESRDALVAQCEALRAAVENAYRLIGQISSVQLTDNDARKKVSDAHANLSAGIRALSMGKLNTQGEQK